jgi:hypothetical protein
MTSRDFCYWLQGHFEINNAKTLNAKQTEMIKRHLNLVFKHEIDPSMGSKKHIAKLRKVHSPKPKATKSKTYFDPMNTPIMC